MSKEQSIQLDCPPGHPRPGDLLPAVLDGTGIPVREPDSTFFGCWTWDYGDIPPKVWEQANDRIAERIVALFREGAIRYGSW